MILQVAILAVPLRRTFDYLPPKNIDPDTLKPGIRLRVPFGRQQRIGILLSIQSNSNFAINKLKPVDEIIDPQPLFPEALHQLLLQAARYYHHPLGEVLDTALPALLRQGRAATPKQEKYYALTSSGATTAADTLKRAPRQQQIMEQLQQQPLSSTQLAAHYKNWREPTLRLIEKGLVKEIEQRDSEASPLPTDLPHPLNREQQQAIDAIQQQTHSTAPTPILLEGVTGSGKTEVYLQAMQPVLEQGRQVLILVPEISLTPQTVRRFQNRFGLPIALLHSGRNQGERFNDWLHARSGHAKIIIGTRSAIFTPLQAPGMIIVDEEHDSSFKQQEGFRYSARDIAVLRAQREQIPVILGSATPSFESLHNSSQEKYHKAKLTQRAGDAATPELSLIDMRSRKVDHLLSAPLLEKIQHHLQQQGQVLLFLNRRGYAPVLLCKGCGWSMSCPRCDIHYTYHQGRKRLICHHCGGERPFPTACPECGGETMKSVGAGTERIEEALQQQFPNHSISRIDRDTTRKRGAMERLLEEIQDGQHQLLLGTQMLAKGHHFPNVTLVAILDADGGLFGSDFRATEQMGQLITQVAGRAGRENRKGEMVIQTHNPDHPLLLTLLREGYPAFSRQALSERKLAQLPPYSFLALIRAEAAHATDAYRFLNEVREIAQSNNGGTVEILGPIPSPMEKRAGRYRLQLLLQSTQRSTLHGLLQPLTDEIEQLKSSRKVRWSLDVDPVDML